MIKLKNLLTENPNEIKLTPEFVKQHGLNNDYLHWRDRDAFVFGYYKNKMYGAYEENHTTIYYGLNKADKAQLIKDIGQGAYPDDRESFEYPGRAWTTPKVISFWKYPPKSKMNKIINDLRKKGININNDWYIQVVDKGGKYEVPDTRKNFMGWTLWDIRGKDIKLVKIKDYVGSEKQKGKGIKHAISPMLKKKDIVPKGVGSKKKVKGSKKDELPVATKFRQRKGLGDNTIKLKPLLELTPKNKWVTVKGKELVQYKQDIFDLIQNAYKNIGGHAKFKSSGDISNKDTQFFHAIDLDDKPDPEAVRVMKKKPAGNKLVATGHDGSNDSKRAAVKYTGQLLKKRGYYIEVSGKMYEILKSLGTHEITDKKTVEDVLYNEKINWLGDGWYERNIGGKVYKKIMMGYPKT